MTIPNDQHVTLVIGVSTLVCVLGGAVYRWAKEAKWAELGRLAFACGLLAALLKL